MVSELEELNLGYLNVRNDAELHALKGLSELKNLKQLRICVAREAFAVLETAYIIKIACCSGRCRFCIRFVPSFGT